MLTSLQQEDFATLQVEIGIPPDRLGTASVLQEKGILILRGRHCSHSQLLQRLQLQALPRKQKFCAGISRSPCEFRVCVNFLMLT